MNKTLIEEGFWSSLNISSSKTIDDTQPICKDKDKIRSHSLTFIDTRPNPLKCVDTIWASSNEALLILFYIESPFIYIESFELGLAPCRFLVDYKTTNIDKKTGEGKKSIEKSIEDTTTSVKSIQDDSSIFDFCITKEMGCSALTDGVYVWPEGFAHYIRRHGVKPSDQFIKHILEKVKSLGMMLNMNLDMNKISHGYKRLLYDPESGEGVALPAETKSYLSLHSSLIGL